MTRHRALLIAVLSALAATSTAGLNAASALAAKQVYSYFGTPSGFASGGGEFHNPSGVAVNNTGAGPAQAGEIYVIDSGSNRIERFSRDSEGEFNFVSAWGAGVQTDGTNYEVCVTAANCHAAIASGGNGTVAGDGALDAPRSIAVDQDTGTVYVLDAGSSRVNAYEGDGTFLRSFGWDVTVSGPSQGSGPDEEQQLTVKATGGKFSLSFAGRSTGPIGVGRRTAGSKTITVFHLTEGTLAVGQSVSGRGIAPGSTITKIEAGTLTLSRAMTEGGFGDEVPLYVDTLPFNASAAELESALNALSTIGGAGGSVAVSRSEPNAGELQYTIRFEGALAGEDVSQIAINSTESLSGDDATASVSTAVPGGAPEVCTAAAGDVCKAASAGAREGQIGAVQSDGSSPSGLAVSQPDGNPATGTVFVNDQTNQRVNTYNLAGVPQGSFGPTNSDGRSGDLAVDSRGIVYISNRNEIERYDRENANGEGVAFLAPIPLAINETQMVTVRGSEGQFRLSFGGDTTADIPVNAEPQVAREALEALPSIGVNGIKVSRSENTPALRTYVMTFEGSLFGQDVEQLGCENGTAPLGGSGAFVSAGGGSDGNTQQLSVYAAAGQYRLRFYGLRAQGKVNQGSPVIVVNDDRTAGAITPGEPVIGEGIPAGATVVSFTPGPPNTPGELIISANATASSRGIVPITIGPVATTSDLPFNTTASDLKSALEALPSIGGIGGSVNISGGPGDPTGSSPYTVTFGGAFTSKDANRLEVLQGATPLSGAATECSVATKINGSAGAPGGAMLTVEPDSDGEGSDKDVLLAGSRSEIVQFGPLNQPSQVAPPSALDAVQGGTSQLNGVKGLAVDEASGDIYATSIAAAGREAHGVYVLGAIGSPPTASMDSIDGLTSTTATAHGTVNPNGPPNTRFSFEYSSDGSHWDSTPNILVGKQTTLQAVQATLDPPPGGLKPNTLYHVRLVVTKPGNSPVTTAQLTFTTLGEAPRAETTGSPIRTPTTAQLSGRINPRNSASTYHFEYGTEGPCDANPCQVTEAMPAGSGEQVEMVSVEVTGLEPNTRYHYRLVGESSAPGPPSFGEDMMVKTRASEAPLSHGHLPGPIGSDRAYEQVNMPDTGGNPVVGALGFSANGDRALYRVFGGTPQSDAGSFVGMFFTQRTSSGWQTELISPPREEQVGSAWDEPVATSDLSQILSANKDLTSGEAGIWQLHPGSAATSLFAPVSPQHYESNLGVTGAYGLSEDGSTAAAVLLGGELDPSYPAAAATNNVYEIDGGLPKLLSLLPDNQVAACGVPLGENSAFGFPHAPSRWISPNGSSIVFPSKGSDCSSEQQLYRRELQEEETKLISGPAVSTLTCGAILLKSTSSGIFFWTQSRLAVEDSAVSSCIGAAGGDVYRYDAAAESLECVTCAAPGLSADVEIGGGANGGPRSIAVANDGTRVYFSTKRQLLSGANEPGEVGAYRVNVQSRNLAYVASASVGEAAGSGNALSADGKVLLFRSASSTLNTLGGLSTNGGTKQYYLYDDEDRSLVCASCPQDGRAPTAEVPQRVAAGEAPELDLTPLSANGQIFAFATPIALVGTDQNTPPEGESPKVGTDIYEWRDGLLSLITEGLGSWPNEQEPRLEGVSPSGKDIFFLAAASYTPDALDAYLRLYDARIGGGFEFPAPPMPCPLEVCQGTPKGTPEEQTPGSSSFSGPGNVHAPAKVKKHKRKVRKHVKKHKRVKRHRHHAKRVSRERRASR